MAVRVKKDVNNQISDKVHGNSSPNLNLIFDKNPYLDGLKIKAVRRDGGYERDSSGDFVRSSFITEKDERTHVFLNKDNKARVARLSASGMRLYMWIIYTLKIKEDKYWLNTKKFMRETNVTINTMKAGIKELLDKDIIRPTSVKNVFFIDPKLFFRGSRLDEYEDYIEVVDSRITLKKEEKKKTRSEGGKGYINDNVSDSDFTNDINEIF